MTILNTLTYNVHRCLSDGLIFLLKALDSELVRLQFALEDAVLLLQRLDAFLPCGNDHGLLN